MVYLSSDNIICSLGTNTSQVLSSIEKGVTGISDNSSYSSITKAPVSPINKEQVKTQLTKHFPGNTFTQFESTAILSLFKTVEQGKFNPASPRTLFILSTTKGNIELLSTGENISPDILLFNTAQKIARLFGFINRPVVVCNACISGVLALIQAKRYIESGKYDHVVVTGADVITDFIVAGFESFKSMSEKPCRPFDADRDGLSLGEGAGTLLVTNQHEDNRICINRGASANDANHISGPSRTGEGLYLAGKNTLLGETNIDFISAHGTATPYNDDMESHAISRLNLSEVPVNSFKGYFGHTLGAAGIIETILTKHSMLNNRTYSTLGLNNLGTVKPINAINRNRDVQINRCLKLASGFGGCNAALLLDKNG
jgi:3-oxoacyl-[acyl-carrier-protein] synthase-1